MNKILKSFLCITLVCLMILGMAACSKDEPKKNDKPTNQEINTKPPEKNNPDKTEPVETTPVQNTDPVVTDPVVTDPVMPPVPTEDKQSLYEDLINNHPDEIEFASKNMIIETSTQGLDLTSMTSENGDMMLSLMFNGQGYTSYKVGNESYMEIHMVTMDEDGNINEEGQSLYYKITGMEDYEPTSMMEQSELEETFSKAFESITYLDTIGFHGVKCDVIQAVANDSADIVDWDTELEDDDVNSKNDEDEDDGEDLITIGAEEIEKQTIRLYFIEGTSKLFGFAADTTAEGEPVEIYFPDSVTITVPDVEWEETDEETLGMTLFSVMMMLIMSQQPAE